MRSGAGPTIRAVPVPTSVARSAIHSHPSNLERLRPAGRVVRFYSRLCGSQAAPRPGPMKGSSTSPSSPPTPRPSKKKSPINPPPLLGPIVRKHCLTSRSQPGPPPATPTTPVPTAANSSVTKVPSGIRTRVEDGGPPHRPKTTLVLLSVVATPAMVRGHIQLDARWGHS